MSVNVIVAGKITDEAMRDLQEAHIVTAGAYVVVNDSYPFVIGPNPRAETLAVVRLGGHREAGETGWQCAAREVYEEACIHIHPLSPPATYWLDGDHSGADVQQISWLSVLPHHLAPLLVVSFPQTREGQLSVMYLAHTDEQPTPGAEVRGLLFLKPYDVHAIVQQSITLGQYLRSGGQALLHDCLAEDRVLEPFLQLRALSRILQIHQNRLMEPV